MPFQGRLALAIMLGAMLIPHAGADATGGREDTATMPARAGIGPPAGGTSTPIEVFSPESLLSMPLLFSIRTRSLTADPAVSTAEDRMNTLARTSGRDLSPFLRTLGELSVGIREFLRDIRLCYRFGGNDTSPALRLDLSPRIGISSSNLEMTLNLVIEY